MKRVGPSTAICSIFLVLLAAAAIAGQSNQFGYQGSLNTGGTPANGNYDFVFALYDSLSGTTQFGPTLTRNSVAVSAGVFSVNLDFGSQFPGANRFLEIQVRQTGGGAFTPLSPRQMINSSPYSVKSLNAENAVNATNATTATNATQLGGVAANQYVVTTDTRMTDARNPLPGSANYIWNQNKVLQPSSNFVISGNGDAGGTLSGNAINATTQYNIGFNRVLSVAGTNNVFAGVGAGTANTTGNSNSFFGANAGDSNAMGNDNSFFGRSSGELNTDGFNNAFFGRNAGFSNIIGSRNAFFGAFAGQANTASFNSFFGQSAGEANTTGGNNSFFGRSAGANNQTGADNSYFGSGAGFGSPVAEGSANSFFGSDAGLSNRGNDNAFFGRSAGITNTMGSDNAFFGRSAGGQNTTGSNNAFFGRNAGGANATGDNNTILGAFANVSGNFSFATAVGAGAVVNASNTVVIGRADDIVRIPGFLRVVQLGSPGSTSLCQNVNDTISTCSSSIRYKSNITVFRSGLDLIKRLRPVSFNWKDGGMLDMGLVAEEVAEVEPLLVTTNKQGEIEGVKYDRVGVVLVNAVKEQQTEIEDLRRQISELKALVCTQNPSASLCDK
jgi:hypothetical protein